MAEIYGLYSGRDGKVRYVGQTSGSRHTRFKQHQRCQAGRYYSAVYTWLQEEWKACYPVNCALLEKCCDEACDDLEIGWMSRFPNLLNERDYYYCGGKVPVIPEIKEYMRKFVFNSGGYRGIHWWRQLDRYSVFVYLGEIHGWTWLRGDGAPGWQGDIWFSDLNHALESRDKIGCNWLPDIEQEASLNGDCLRNWRENCDQFSDHQAFEVELPIPAPSRFRASPAQDRLRAAGFPEDCAMGVARP